MGKPNLLFAASIAKAFLSGMEKTSPCKRIFVKNTMNIAWSYENATVHIASLQFTEYFHFLKLKASFK